MIGQAKLFNSIRNCDSFIIVLMANKMATGDLGDNVVPLANFRSLMYPFKEAVSLYVI